MLTRWLRREESQGVDTAVAAGGEPRNFCHPGWSKIDPTCSICCAITSNPSLPFLLLPDIEGGRYNRDVEIQDNGGTSMS